MIFSGKVVRMELNNVDFIQIDILKSRILEIDYIIMHHLIHFVHGEN